MSDYSPILLELSAQRASLGRVARALRMGIAAEEGRGQDDDKRRELSACCHFVEAAMSRVKQAEDRYRNVIDIDNREVLPKPPVDIVK